MDLWLIYEGIYAFLQARLIKPFWRWYLRQRRGRTKLAELLTNSDRALHKHAVVERQLAKSSTRATRSILDLKVIDPEDIPVYVDFIMEHEGLLADSEVNVEKCRLALTESLTRISGYKNLLFELKNLGMKTFQDGNEKHERLLKELWDMMNPFEKFSGRDSPRWRILGFSQSDPVADLQPPVGMLALRCLHNFAKVKNEQARFTYSNAHHPERWYRWAATGIALCGFLVAATEDGVLKNHFYHCEEHRPGMEEFYETFTAAFIAFDRFWRCRLGSVSEFLYILKDFETEVARQLRDPDVVFSHDVLNDDEETRRLEDDDDDWRQMIDTAVEEREKRRRQSWITGQMEKGEEKGEENEEEEK